MTSTTSLNSVGGTSMSNPGTASIPSSAVVTLDALDKECSALGGLFQTIINDMKIGVPHYEEFASKASKLHAQLKTTILVLSSFLDTFQKIADAATNTKGATRDIGSCLTRIVIRHRAMESRMKSLCGALLESLVSPLQDKLEDWKRNVLQLDKDHSKEYKKLRAEIKKRSENASRAQKKCTKKSAKHSVEAQKAAESANNELNKHYKMLLETEKSAVRKALVEERQRYCAFALCVKPLVDEEVGLVSEFQQLEEVSKKLSKHTEEPYKLHPASEQVINDLSSNSTESNFKFKTPPSSPSSLGSRKGSMCSISSASSNSSLHPSPHHHHHQGLMPGGATLRHNRSQQKTGSNNLVDAMMRLSSISSQDSGFTSQDTLFLRPNSPSNKAKVPDGDMSSAANDDRPHTISTAYEKGHHQRPQIQSYTFEPPLNEKFLDSSQLSMMNSSQESLFKKPPVPQRCVSLDSSNVSRGIQSGLPVKPALPSSRKPILTSATSQQIPTSGSDPQHLPNFDGRKEDMVLPQPVYMNMSDLAAMAAQKAQNFQQSHPTIEEEEAQDLKTPTVEELSVAQTIQKVSGVNGDGSSSTSESSMGSSSGYGSQSTVRIEEQQNQSLTEDMPLPAPLLDSTKYHSLPRQHSFPLQNPQQQHYYQHLQELGHHNNYVHNFQQSNQTHCNSRSLHHRPFSFTQSSIQEVNESELGSGVAHPHISTLRRANSNAGATLKPQQLRQPMTNSFDLLREERTPPPPPAPQAHIAPQQSSSLHLPTESNSSTPKGSMEHLPPPPPHLLHSDEEDNHLRMALENINPGASEPKSVIAQRGVSVAESVLALQKSGHLPCSPKSLRRAHSVTGAHSPYHQQQKQQHQEAIYAPVAHLQQKLQQRQQQQMRSPEGEQYGFGVQFKQHQHQFFDPSHLPSVPTTGNNSSHDQIMGQVDTNMRNRPRPPPMSTIPGQQQQQFPSNYDAQTAMRVRKWIESRSVSDVRKCRPILNTEIHQGLTLRKTSDRNDRSAPRF